MEKKPDHVSDILDKNTTVTDIMDKFNLTKLQAETAWHVHCGDNIFDVTANLYSGERGRTNRNARDLLSTWKFKEALNYLSDGDFVQDKIGSLKLQLLYYGIDKMNTFRNENAKVGIYKLLMGLAYEDKLPDKGKEIGRKLDKLAEHFRESEKAKDQVVKNIEGPLGELEKELIN